MIDNKLTESALWLTGKTMADMEKVTPKIAWWLFNRDIEFTFSIEKFCYYLLSPEFIEAYENMFIRKWIWVREFWRAIYEYQLNNPEPLKELLSKIK